MTSKIKLRKRTVYEVEFPDGSTERMEQVGPSWNGMIQLRCPSGQIVVDTDESLGDLLKTVIGTDSEIEATPLKASPSLLARAFSQPSSENTGD